MTERELLRRVQLAVGARPDCRVFRNSVGIAVDPRTGQHIRFGLAPGSSDLIGWVRRSSCGCARFFAAECKSDTGRETPEQAAFGRAVRTAGGLYVLARSEGEVVRAVEEASSS